MEFPPLRKEFAEIAETLAREGAEFIGFQDSPRGRLFLFSDIFTGTTLALVEFEVCPEAVSRRLQESRNSRASEGSKRDLADSL